MTQAVIENEEVWGFPSESASNWLADGFVARVSKWAGQALDEQVLACVRGLSLASAAGHVCLPLDQLTPDMLKAWRPASMDTTAFDLSLSGLENRAGRGPSVEGLSTALMRSGLVVPSTSTQIAPMVLDSRQRLYLARFYDLEQRLATRVRALLEQRWVAPEPEVLKALAQWFGIPPEEGEHEQFNAACQALRQGLTLISGGPGTGKTTTLLSIVGGFLMMQPGCRIALAAPTGKAAARMMQALSERAAVLPTALREQLPHQATTVHRLLGPVTRHSQQAARNRPTLDADVVVIDEASMLDLSTATRLFEAIPETARMILIGDPHQLASVEAGSVFAELIHAQSDSSRFVSKLQRNRRFSAGSGIGALAKATEAGDGGELRLALKKAQVESGSGISWIDPLQTDQLKQAIQDGYAPYLEAVQAYCELPAQSIQPGGPLELSETIERAMLHVHERAQGFRVLCAQRQGPAGVAQINDRIAAWLAEHGSDKARPSDTSGWFAGRMILVTKNDPASGLFNGDMGIALRGPDGRLKVSFLTTESPPAIRLIPIERLPAHDTAFAITIHKSQGSEFDHVLLLLGAKDSPVLSRELLYTGLTRAKAQVSVVASEAVLEVACGRRTQRWSGLADAIRTLQPATRSEQTPTLIF